SHNAIRTLLPNSVCHSQNEKSHSICTSKSEWIAPPPKSFYYEEVIKLRGVQVRIQFTCARAYIGGIERIATIRTLGHT
ncbi:Uncharacterized protein APZ42_008240, partial [Daphnia magna]